MVFSIARSIVFFTPHEANFSPDRRHPDPVPRVDH